MDGRPVARATTCRVGYSTFPILTEYLCTRDGGVFFTARMKSSRVNSYRLPRCTNVSFFVMSGSHYQNSSHNNHLSLHHQHSSLPYDRLLCPLASFTAARIGDTTKPNESGHDDARA